MWASNLGFLRNYRKSTSHRRSLACRCAHYTPDDSILVDQGWKDRLLVRIIQVLYSEAHTGGVWTSSVHLLDSVRLPRQVAWMLRIKGTKKPFLPLFNRNGFEYRCHPNYGIHAVIRRVRYLESKPNHCPENIHNAVGWTGRTNKTYTVKSRRCIYGDRTYTTKNDSVGNVEWFL